MKKALFIVTQLLCPWVRGFLPGHPFPNTIEMHPKLLAPASLLISVSPRCTHTCICLSAIKCWPFTNFAKYTVRHKLYQSKY